MILEKIDGLKVYIIESLSEDDKKTGEELKDYLRQIWYDQNLTKDFACQYNFIHNQEEMLVVFSDIERQVTENNKIPIVQIECHGSVEGILLKSNELVTWKELFCHIRPINIASLDTLFLNLSMCNGETVFRYIDPTKRSPFRAVIGPEGEVFPDELMKSWLNFYTNFEKYTEENLGVFELANSSGLIYYSQEFIFDAYYDLANQAPVLFEALRTRELYEMFKSGGLLLIDPKMHNKWVAKRQAEIKEKYRPFFCFEDLQELRLEAYYTLKIKEEFSEQEN